MLSLVYLIHSKGTRLKDVWGSDVTPRQKGQKGGP